MSNETETMNKKSKRTLTPRLRFPEFRDKPGWEEKPLGTCLDYQQPTPYLVSDTNYSPAFNTPVLTAGKTFILGYTSEKHGIFSKDLPVIIFDDFTTATQFVDFPFKVKSSAMKILLAKNGANIKFMFEILQTLSYEVGAHERHWISIFSPMLVPVPKPAEQQKIADCLSSLDNLISAEGRKLAALRDHKRGLMQQLFPQPGQTQPRLRFPEFRDKGGWEEKAISELGEVITGSTPSTTRSEYYGGDRQFVSPADISELRFVRETKTTLTELGFQQTRPIKAKSVLFVCIGSTIGKIAQNLKDCATNQQINSIIAGPGISADFLYYLLSECSERIAMIAGNQAVPIINKSLFSGFKVLCPKEDEQHRIADCLTALDTQIAAQTAKIESLKQHKRGLMQQLFPAPEEIDS
jgi:type I restriction enzyme S subunit